MADPVARAARGWTRGKSAASVGTPYALHRAMEYLAAMVIMLLVAFATLPEWPYAARWGYYPSGACGALLLMLVGLILTGHF